MTPKFKTNLMALAVALGALVAGYGFGGPPSQPIAGVEPVASLAVATPDLDAVEADEQAAILRSGRVSLKRQIAMPYVSMAALMPRRES